MSLTVRSRLLCAAAIGGVALFAGPAQAQTSATLNVTASVPQQCSFLTQNATIDFGDYSGARKTGTASFDVQCLVNANVGVTLDPGVHANGTTRRLEHVTNTGAHLGYALFNGSPDGGDVWANNATKTFSASGGAPTTIIIGGELVDGQPLLATGAYTDTVTLTLAVQP